MPSWSPPTPFPGLSPVVSKRPPGVLVFAQLGMMGAVCLLGGGALGWFVDSEAGTLPLFLLAGLLLGGALAAVTTWREVRKYL